MKYLVFLMLLPQCMVSPVYSDTSSNAVNERIPVGNLELEAHWNVDCSSLWKQFLELQVHSEAAQCVVPAKLYDALRLCEFIYQAPGSGFTHKEPDYQAAVQKCKPAR